MYGTYPFDLDIIGGILEMSKVPYLSKRISQMDPAIRKDQIYIS